MGLIIKNGIRYFGDNSVELTQAQYDALSQAEKLNGTTYYITDGQNITTASAVTYDNTDSGLTATDVNAAIDEVNAKTGSDIAVSSSSSETIAEALSALFLINTYTATVIVGANDVTSLKGQDMGYNSIPSGYTPIVYSFSCTNSNDLFLNLYSLTAIGSQQFGVIRNVSVNPQNNKNCTIKITFIKSAFL